MLHLDHLSITKKFLLLGLLTLFMLAPPTLLLLGSKAELIRSSRAEVAGLAPTRELLELIRLTQQHRGASAGYLSGNEAMKAKREELQTATQQALDAVQTLPAELVTSEVQRLVKQISTDWNSLRQDVSQKSIPGPESFRRHTALIAYQLDLLAELIDSAHLSLEPQSGNYHLIMATLQDLPYVTEYLGQIRAKGTAALSSRQLSAQGGAELQSLAAMAQARMHTVQRHLDKALAADPALKPVIDAARQNAASQLASIQQLVQRVVGEFATIDLPAADYFKQTTQSIDAQFGLITTAVPQISTRLEQRAAAEQRQSIGTAALVLLLTISGLWIGRRVAADIVGALGRAVDVTQRVAAGDLSQRLSSSRRDEIGTLLSTLDRMSVNLASMVGAVRAGTDAISTASAQIAQGNLDLSSRTEQQAAHLQQTAAAMDQVNRSVSTSADHAQQATELARQASSVVTQGGAAVDQVVQTMNEIQASSRKIVDIIGVIDGIAFQTNILALNAAVEAARAGEQGRGFAVVAGEVRTLAQRSAQAAREIKTLIGASVAKVESGNAQVASAGSTIRDTVQHVQRVNALINEISAASASQQQGTSQINHALAQLDQSTQQNAALVEETAAAAESMRLQAGKLAEAIGAFRLVDHQI
ncbi:MAG: hypothetical protein RJA44_2544 [Pseudomonadota bacterium]